ncbi:MAG: hypothetical protein ABF479_20865, partial [Gluconacetobacter sp.]
MNTDEPAPRDASPLAAMRQKMNQADAAFRRDLPAAGAARPLPSVARGPRAPRAGLGGGPPALSPPP